jgi:DnaK suppressor protein
VTLGGRDGLARARAEAGRVVEDLRSELAAIAESTEAGPDDEHDAEGSTVGFERARVTALLRAAEASLARLDGALERRRLGRYGRCERCGEAIAPERLLAVPGTACCGACARLPGTEASLRPRGPGDGAGSVPPAG